MSLIAIHIAVWFVDSSSLLARYWRPCGLITAHIFSSLFSSSSMPSSCNNISWQFSRLTGAASSHSPWSLYCIFIFHDMNTLWFLIPSLHCEWLFTWLSVLTLSNKTPERFYVSFIRGLKRCICSLSHPSRGGISIQRILQSFNFNNSNSIKL